MIFVLREVNTKTTSEKRLDNKLIMNYSLLDVTVIGAGHAGLSISYHLKKLNLSHIVFEKGRIGDTWRNQRWDSFRLNTPNKVNSFPGWDNGFTDPDGFAPTSEFVSLLENYATSFNLPVIQESSVLSVENIPGTKDFSVYVMKKGSPKYYRTKSVVVASGSQNIKIIPSFGRNISPGILQLHSADYRNASLLPDGAVLVVGSGQSGVQIAEDLISGGRKVFISTSQVPRVPRRYRGRDIVEWLIITGFFDMRTRDVSDSQILAMKQPQVSTAGRFGHSISLQGLAKSGAVVLGKTRIAQDETVYLQPDAATHIKFADDFSRKVKDMIDGYIQKSQLNSPSPNADPDDDPDESASCASDLTKLNLAENKITSIIWTTGFTGDFSYLKLPVLAENGTLKHNEGISDIEGLYFLGLPWLRKRKSGIIPGIKEDAGFIAEKILEYSGNSRF
jgi:putative flavoprotein involved in K+ transport